MIFLERCLFFLGFLFRFRERVREREKKMVFVLFCFLLRSFIFLANDEKRGGGARGKWGGMRSFFPSRNARVMTFVLSAKKK